MSMQARRNARSKLAGNTAPVFGFELRVSHATRCELATPDATLLFRLLPNGILEALPRSGLVPLAVQLLDGQQELNVSLSCFQLLGLSAAAGDLDADNQGAKAGNQAGENAPGCADGSSLDGRVVEVEVEDRGEIHEGSFRC